MQRTSCSSKQRTNATTARRTRATAAGRTVIAAALLGAGCVRTPDDFAHVDLRRLDSGDDMVLVGSVHVVVDGADRTEHSSFETDGTSGSFQLPASGAVIWVVGQHRSDEAIHLSWIAPRYGEDALGLGERIVVARGDRAGEEHCWYFGKVTVRVGFTANDRRAGAIIGWALPQGFVSQVEDEVEHRAELARQYPGLSGLTCTAAVSNVPVAFPE